jgi:hypothetical protein
MLDSREQNNRDVELETPGTLAEDLAVIGAPDLPVPPEVDRAILVAARRHFALGRRTQRRQPRPLLRWAPVGVIVAAAALLLSLLLPSLQSSRERAMKMEQHAQGRQVLPQDLDRSGEVDILDAFFLARQIERPAGLRPEWDMNGDGKVDGEDVKQIAHAAVSMTGNAAPRSTLQ